MLFYLSQNLGNLLAMFSGLLLPPDKNKQELIDTNIWYYIYGFPIILYGIMILLLLTVVIHDSPKFLIVQNKREECL